MEARSSYRSKDSERRSHSHGHIIQRQENLAATREEKKNDTARSARLKPKRGDLVSRDEALIPTAGLIERAETGRYAA